MIDAYFRTKRISAGATPQPGELWRGPITFVYSTHEVMRPNTDNPSSLANIRYRILTDPVDLYHHNPYHSLRLPSDEEILPIRAKIRPCPTTVQVRDDHESASPTSVSGSG